jgi:hypothetical protein
MERRWRPLVIALLACCGAGAGYAVVRAESPLPVTPRARLPPDARIWKKLEDAARADSGPSGARRVAIAEVGYPRSAAEANMLGGQALLLVSAMAEKIGDAVIERVTAHFENGLESELVRVTEQLNEFDGEAQPAARLVGPYRHDSLHFIQLSATGTKAYVTATYAGGAQVVIRFPRAPAAYPSTLPVPKADLPASITEVGAIARALYPFFRTAPLRSPGAETTCTLHGPANPTESPEPTRPAEAKLSEGRLAPLSGRGPRHATVKGSLDKEVIRRVIGAHVGEVESCYARELWSIPKLSGRVMVRFTIAAEGWVTASALESSTLDNKRLTDCIVGVVRCWRFPKPIGGGIVIVSYPWALTPPS